MRIAKPLQAVGSPLHYFLAAELPLLLVTIALFAWSLDPLSDALRFQKLADQHDGDKRGFGFEYGTQLITRTSTRTGWSSAYTLIPSTRTLMSRTVDGRAVTETITYRTPTTRSSATSSTSGTFTTTYTFSIYPYIRGTAYYSDVYAHAGIQPSEAVRVESTTPATPATPVTPRAAVPTAAPTAALAKRDASWSNGNTYEGTHHGLFQTWDEGVITLTLFVVCAALCIVFLWLRLIVTCAYLVIAHIHQGHGQKREGIARHAINAILAFAVLAFVVCAALGLTLWIVLGSEIGIDSPDVLATLAFWAISSIATFVVMVMAARRIDVLNKEKKRSTLSGNEKMGSDSSSSVV